MQIKEILFFIIKNFYVQINRTVSIFISYKISIFGRVVIKYTLSKCSSAWFISIIESERSWCNI